MNDFHEGVLKKEVTDYLQIKSGGKYIDATLGGGGHTKEILKKGGIVLGIDLDDDALDYVSENLKEEIESKKLTISKGNFSDIDKIARLYNFENVNGIIFDLGISSHQINTPSRGFSFLRKGPLDMRMDTKSPITAEKLVNLLEKGELNEIFYKFGQENRSRAISDSIVSARRIKALKTTDDLVDAIKSAYGIKGKISNFTKNKISQKVFQAIRIAVNQELSNLEKALPKAVNLLESRGRLGVITFHSLEDKIVKNMFKKFEKENLGKIITKKPLVANDLEIAQNQRAKSAKLRVFEKSL
jgi:16S rRNA (cytosine1402-N4)-methyltransferase